MSRPEDLLPPDLFYNDTESRKYTTSSRIQAIQTSMTLRALELLNLARPSFILDVGCGSGLSGEILSDPAQYMRDDDSEEQDEDDNLPASQEMRGDTALKHMWIGLDISPSMLSVALERDVEGDLFLSDMGQGLAFRPGTFDAAISISAIQWLCNAESSSLSSSPEQRLRRFFDSLYASLKRGGKAVLQFYPKNDAQRGMISAAAVRAGFGAGILEDDGGTKNVKVYLVLSVGGGDITGAVEGMDGVDVEDGRNIRDGRMKAMMNGQSKNGKRKDKEGSKAWIMKRKDKMKNKGKIVKSDSKYTGRNRGPKF